MKTKKEETEENHSKYKSADEALEHLGTFIAERQFEINNQR